jgi:hypothetical protein
VPIYRDLWGTQIRASDERLLHIRDRHPELVGLENPISLALEQPDFVVESDRDSSIRVYERRVPDSPVGDKRLRAIVKWHPEDAFLLSSYFTDRARKGRQLWP